MTHDLPLRRTQTIGRVHLGNPHTRHAGPRRNRHNPQCRKEQQDNLANLANPRPDNHQRDQGKRRHRAHEFDNRIKPATEPVRQPHRIAQRNPHNRPQQKTDNHAEQRITQMLQQRRIAIPVSGNINQPGPYGLGGRQPDRLHLDSLGRCDIQRALGRHRYRAKVGFHRVVRRNRHPVHSRNRYTILAAQLVVLVHAQQLAAIGRNRDGIVLGKPLSGINNRVRNLRAQRKNNNRYRGVIGAGAVSRRIGETAFAHIRPWHMQETRQ